MTPFDPQPLTPVQQQQVADKQAAADKLIEIDSNIAATKAQLGFLYDAWVSHSALPAQNPNDPNVPIRESIAAEYWKAFTLLNRLIDFRGAVLGWKLGIGQPNHPPMPTLTV